MATDPAPERQQWDNLVTELDAELIVFGRAGLQFGRILYKIKLHLQANGLDKTRTGRWANILRERKIAESTAKDWVVKYQQAEGIASDRCFFKSEMTRVKRTRNSHKYREKNTAVSAALEQTRIACADDRDTDNRDKNERMAVECIFVLTLGEKLDFMKAVSKLGSLRATQCMYKAVVSATEEV